jgi:hypothetical protein
MTTKLTLSIDTATIEKAKRISAKRRKSISKMVEEYLNSLPEKNTAENAMEAMKRIMNSKKTKSRISSSRSYKELWQQHLEEKHKASR